MKDPPADFPGRMWALLGALISRHAFVGVHQRVMVHSSICPAIQTEMNRRCTELTDDANRNCVARAHRFVESCALGLRAMPETGHRLKPECQQAFRRHWRPLPGTPKSAGRAEQKTKPQVPRFHRFQWRFFCWGRWFVVIPYQ